MVFEKVIKDIENQQLRTRLANILELLVGRALSQKNYISEFFSETRLPSFYLAYVYLLSLYNTKISYNPDLEPNSELGLALNQILTKEPLLKIFQILELNNSDNDIRDFVYHLCIEHCEILEHNKELTYEMKLFFETNSMKKNLSKNFLKQILKKL